MTQEYIERTFERELRKLPETLREPIQRARKTPPAKRSAAQHKLPLTVVVINNQGYGAMRSFSQVMQVRNVPGLDLPGIDFVKIAEGHGCHAVRVTKAAELAPALEQGLTYDGVSLVEVMVDSSVPLLYAQRGRT